MKYTRNRMPEILKNYEGRKKARESIILEGYLCYNL